MRYLILLFLMLIALPAHAAIINNAPTYIVINNHHIQIDKHAVVYIEQQAGKTGIFCLDTSWTKQVFIDGLPLEIANGVFIDKDGKMTNFVFALHWLFTMSPEIKQMLKDNDPLSNRLLKTAVLQADCFNIPLILMDQPPSDTDPAIVDTDQESTIAGLLDTPPQQPMLSEQIIKAIASQNIKIIVNNQGTVMTGGSGSSLPVPPTVQQEIVLLQTVITSDKQADKTLLTVDTSLTKADTTLNKTDTSLTKQITTLKTTDISLTTTNNQLTSQNTSLTNQDNSLNNQDNTLTSDIAKQQAIVSKDQAKLLTAKPNQVNALNTAIANAQTKISNDNADISANTATITANRATISHNSAVITSNAQLLTNNNAKITTLNNQITANKQTITHNKITVVANKTVIKTNTAQIHTDNAQIKQLKK